MNLVSNEAIPFSDSMRSRAGCLNPANVPPLPCDWQAPWRDTFIEAEADADQHRRDTGHPCMAWTEADAAAWNRRIPVEGRAHQ